MVGDNSNVLLSPLHIRATALAGAVVHTRPSRGRPYTREVSSAHDRPMSRAWRDAPELYDPRKSQRVVGGARTGTLRRLHAEVRIS